MAALAVEPAAPESLSADGRPRAGWVTALVPSSVAREWEPAKAYVADLPLPPICRPFFRAEEPGETTYRAVVRELVARAPGFGRRLAEIAERHGVGGDAFGRAVLVMADMRRCAACDRPYITDSQGQTRYCAEECRRAAQQTGKAAPRGAPTPFLRADCAHCHEPLGKGGVLFCGYQCFRAAERANLALPVGVRRTTCARCDAALRRDQLMFCGVACQRAYTREWLDGLVTR